MYVILYIILYELKNLTNFYTKNKICILILLNNFIIYLLIKKYLYSFFLFFFCYSIMKILSNLFYKNLSIIICLLQYF